MNGVVYNPFPLPPGFAKTDKLPLEPLAQAVLDARAAHPGDTLADLYDPDVMPPNLRRAHQELDRAVDRLYRRRRFTSERERVEYCSSCTNVCKHRWLLKRLRSPDGGGTAAYNEHRAVVGVRRDTQ